MSTTYINKDYTIYLICLFEYWKNKQKEGIVVKMGQKKGLKKWTLMSKDKKKFFMAKSLLH